jgi:hypothetical protein
MDVSGNTEISNTIVHNDGLNASSRYRKSAKGKLARAKYYETKGRTKAQEYYLKNREAIIERSKARYYALQAQHNDISGNIT